MPKKPKKPKKPKYQYERYNDKNKTTDTCGNIRSSDYSDCGATVRYGRGSDRLYWGYYRARL